MIKVKRVRKIRTEKYIKLQNAIKGNNALYNTIKFLYKVLPYTLFIGYPVLIFYLLIEWDLRFIKVITVPAGTFIAVTIMRILINKPRPYEIMEITPLFPKNTKGKSFPSRHVASAAIISFAFLYINIWLGAASFAVTLIISVLRPIAGVHFVKDVIAGFLISSVFGIILFFVL